jgi:carbamoyl-phosphate synthase large subunit
MNILFSCAGRRNYLLRYFKDVIGNDGQVIAADMQNTAPAMAIADKSRIVPEVYALDYVETLLKICSSDNVNAIISLNDLDLPILAAARGRFEAQGTNVLVSSKSIVEICFDKWRTCEFAGESSFGCPQTYLSLEKARQAIREGDLFFPLVLKPRRGSASIGIEIVENLQELELAYELLALKMSRSILSTAAEQDKDGSIMVQEKLIGTEYGLDILNDFSGRPTQVYVKEKLAMRAGETDKAVLRNKPDLETLGFKIGSALGHIGNLDCDVFEINGAYYLLEMNPRFGGGYPFSHMAGADYPAAIVSWLEDKPFDFLSFKKKYDRPFAKFDELVEVAF